MKQNKRKKQMPNNLPVDYKDCSADEEVIVDREGHFLTHYVLAERLIQVEYKDITDDMLPQSETLIYILEGGFRGFHKYTKQQLRDEWLDGAEERWFQMYADKELPWEPYEEDPICQSK